MRVLIVSHNSISTASNMGKTLRSYFQGFDCEEIAQFYIHCEEPTDDTVCHNYYRFTDMDAAKSIFKSRGCGKIFGKQDIRTDRSTARVDTGWVSSLYRFGKRRTPVIYALRDFLWTCSRWDTEQLWQWVDSFDPDVIFFASGDYGFTYEIAGKIAEHVRKPLAVCCVDDHYLYNRNENSLLGRLVHRMFLKRVHKTMARASAIFTICDSLKKEYERYFHKKCYVLPTSAQRWELQETTERSGIVYLGNLELKRYQQLMAIGRALQALDIPGIPQHLDVYSCEQDRNVLKNMTMENGIRFHGPVSGQMVQEILRTSLAVVHTESFDPRIRKIVRHSVSTKIAESLMNGPCMIAYGPEGVASIDYLKENGAAYVITDPEQLEQGLREILADPRLRQEIVGRARELGEQNHSMQAGPVLLRKRLGKISMEQWQYEGVTDQLCLPLRQHRHPNV